MLDVGGVAGMRELSDHKLAEGTTNGDAIASFGGAFFVSPLNPLV